MSPLQTFAKEVTEARKEFEAARERTGWASRWLIFKDAKDAAERIAKENAGGLKVKNHLKVASASKSDNSANPKSDSTSNPK